MGILRRIRELADPCGPAVHFAIAQCHYFKRRAIGKRRNLRLGSILFDEVGPLPLVAGEIARRSDVREPE
jgi:hypothetical protein